MSAGKVLSSFAAAGQAFNNAVWFCPAAKRHTKRKRAMQYMLHVFKKCINVCGVSMPQTFIDSIREYL